VLYSWLMAWHTIPPAPPPPLFTGTRPLLLRAEGEGSWTRRWRGRSETQTGCVESSVPPCTPSPTPLHPPPPDTPPPHTHTHTPPHTLTSSLFSLPHHRSIRQPSAQSLPPPPPPHTHSHVTHIHICLPNSPPPPHTSPKHNPLCSRFPSHNHATTISSAPPPHTHTHTLTLRPCLPAPLLRPVC